MSGLPKNRTQQRRAAFDELTSMLGLPPSPLSSRSAGWAPKAIDEMKSDIVKRLKGKTQGSNSFKFVLAPMTIAPTLPTVTKESLLMDFIESSMTTNELKAAITAFKPEETQSIVTIVGKCKLDEAVPIMFSTLLSAKDKEVSETTTASGAVKADAIKADKLIESSGKKSVDNGADCSVNTIFVEGTTAVEALGAPNASLFLNYIPNTLLSQATPFLEVSIAAPASFDKRDLLQSLGPSLILGKNIGQKDNPKIDTIFTMGNDETSNVIGPDTFNLPQTLGISRDRIGYNLNSLEPVPTNQFAPIAVVTDFSVSYKVNLGSGKIGTGSIVLFFPDKTKLTGIDQLLLGKQGLLTIAVEYGWRTSPKTIAGQGSSYNNIMSDYVNQQRVAEMFTSTISGIEFTESGGARVDLKLTGTRETSPRSVNRLADITTHIDTLNTTSPRYIDLVLKLNDRKFNDDIATTRNNEREVKLILDSSRLKPKPKKSKSGKKKPEPQKQAKRIVYNIADIDKMFPKAGTAEEKTAAKEKIFEIIKIIDSGKLSDSTKKYRYIVTDPSKPPLKEDINSILTAAKAHKLNRSTKKSGKSFQANVKIVEALKDKKVLWVHPDPAVKKGHTINNTLKSLNDALKQLATKMGPRRKNPLKAEISRVSAQLAVDWSSFLSSELLSVDQYKYIVNEAGAPKAVDVYPAGHPLPAVSLLNGSWPPTSKKNRRKTEAQTKADDENEEKAAVISRLNEADIEDERLNLITKSKSYITSQGWQLTPHKSIKAASNTNEGKDIEEKLYKDNKCLNWWLKNKKASTFVPLSHIVHFSLTQTLFASSMYDDIQIIYYKLNDKCKNLSGISIGDIPISIEKTKEVWSTATSPQNFIIDILKTQINVISSPTPYGFSAPSKNKKKKLKDDSHVPDVYMQSQLLQNVQESDGKKVNRKILRVSFIDVNQSIDGGAAEKAHNAATRGTGAVSSVLKTGAATKIVREKMLHQVMKDTNIMEKPNPITGETKIKTGPDVFRILKGAMKAAHPHINYGTIGGAIQSAKISAKLEGSAEMARFHDRAFGKDSSQNRHNSSASGNPPTIPLVAVAGASNSVTLDMIGVPMLAPGTQYFIDFFTDTDADNFYYCKSVEHKFNGGKFSTSAKFILLNQMRTVLPGDADGLSKLLKT